MFAPEYCFQMSKNNRSKISKKSNGNTASGSRKYIVAGGVLAALLAVAYFFFRPGSATVPGMTGKTTEEETLSAESPVLELL